MSQVKGQENEDREGDMKGRVTEAQIADEEDSSENTGSSESGEGGGSYNENSRLQSRFGGDAGIQEAADADEMDEVTPTTVITASADSSRQRQLSSPQTTSPEETKNSSDQKSAKKTNQADIIKVQSLDSPEADLSGDSNDQK